MKTFKKAAALLLAIAICFSAAGCSVIDTSWCAEYKDEKVNVGAYILCMTTGIGEAIAATGTDIDTFLTAKIDENVTGADYASLIAKGEVVRYITYGTKFKELGLTLTDEQKASITSYTENTYTANKDYYDKLGISKESIEWIYTRATMQAAIFDHFYGEGGEFAPEASVIEEKMLEDYARCVYLFWPKYNTADSKMYDDAKIAELKAKSEDAVKRLNEGENFVKILGEVMKEQGETTDYTNRTENDVDVYLLEGEGQFPTAFETALFEMKDGEIKAVEDTSFFYVIKRLPLKEGDEQTIESIKDEVLTTLYYDTFLNTADTWANALGEDIKFNEDMLKLYTAKKVQKMYLSAASEQ